MACPHSGSRSFRSQAETRRGEESGWRDYDHEDWSRHVSLLVRIASIEEDVAARGTDVETEVGIKTGLSHRRPEADRCRTGRRLMPQFRVARDAFLTQIGARRRAENP
jgi:hypothetical protein